MHEDPARSVREKKDASISVAARLVAEGAAAGMVSAGMGAEVDAVSAAAELPGIIKSSPAASNGKNVR